MATKSIQPERIEHINDRNARDGDYVLYWMQQSQRAHYNHALEYAIQRANELNLPVLVVFGLTDDYPEANLRHYQFMLEGLQQTQQSLQDRAIRMIVRHGPPEVVATEAANDAALVICDRGYLRHQKMWRQHVCRHVKCEVVQVESDVVVPVDTVSDKSEYAARTIRPKINKLRDKFLIELRTSSVKKDSLGIKDNGLDLKNISNTLNTLKLDTSVEPVSPFFEGGTAQARTILKRFIDKKLHKYEDNRNHPETNDVSHMSMYLHFGQISPVYLALSVKETKNGSSDDRETYLEELLVRRELAQNFAHFAPNYDSYKCLPKWARVTLREHKNDRREHHYTRQQFENAQTHDPYWNAAMREMKYTGFMHNYMRMYWGKKILEWTNTPQHAYKTALAINNKYFLDGRDANSYANVAWCFGLHDRPWRERPIFGKVRYMNANGLERKCDIKAYVEKVDALTEHATD